MPIVTSTGVISRAELLSGKKRQPATKKKAKHTKRRATKKPKPLPVKEYAVHLNGKKIRRNGGKPNGEQKWWLSLTDEQRNEYIEFKMEERRNRRYS